MICLVPHCAYLSETTRMLEIHRALRAYGVHPRVLTHGGPYERLLNDAKISYDLIGPGLDAARAAAFVRSAVGVGPPTQSMYGDDEIRAYARAEADYFRRHHIQVAVTGFTLTTLLSTRLADVQLVTEHAGCFVPPVLERHLAHLGRRPAETSAYCSGFNRVADELGVPPIPSLAALLLGDLTLVPEVPEVTGVSRDELAAWTPDGRVGYRPETRLAATGPLFARIERPVPDRVRRFLAGSDPVVYVALTSTTPDLIGAVVEALRPLDARILVAGTIHDLPEPSGGQVLVAGVLPSHLVMPEVDLAVTTGGQGSVQTAMATGTPLLGIPLQPEQDLNLMLVERWGAARSVHPSAAGTDETLRIAQHLLGDPAFRAAAGRLQKTYAQVDGPDDAARLVLTAAEEPSG